MVIGQELLYRFNSKINDPNVKQFLTNTVLTQCGISEIFPPFRFSINQFCQIQIDKKDNFGNFRGFEL